MKVVFFSNCIMLSCICIHLSRLYFVVGIMGRGGEREASPYWIYHRARPGLHFTGDIVMVMMMMMMMVMIMTSKLYNSKFKDGVYGGDDTSFPSDLQTGMKSQQFVHICLFCGYARVPWNSKPVNSQHTRLSMQNISAANISKILEKFPNCRKNLEKYFLNCRETMWCFPSPSQTEGDMRLVLSFSTGTLTLFYLKETPNSFFF